MVAAALATVAMWVLWVTPSFESVKAGRYKRSPDVTRDDILGSKAVPEAVLSYAEAVAAETDAAVGAGRDRARTLLTLSAFLLASLTFVTRNDRTPEILVGLAFGAVAVAVLLLLRSLRVSWYGRLALLPPDLALDSADFQRSHAADLLSNAGVNDGVASFLVDVQRAAMRALLVALVALLASLFWPSKQSLAKAELPTPTLASHVPAVLSPKPAPASESTRAIPDDRPGTLVPEPPDSLERTNPRTP